MSMDPVRRRRESALAGLLTWATLIGAACASVVRASAPDPDHAAFANPSSSSPIVTTCVLAVPTWPDLRLAYLVSGVDKGLCPAGHVLHAGSGRPEGRARASRRRQKEGRPSAAAFGRRTPSGARRKRPVVFVHGTPGSAGAFVGYLRRMDLAERFLLISIDRPGFGRTRPRRAEPSLARQAAALTALLAALPAGSPPAILVGHSLGGPVIAKAAVRDPARVGGLVVLAGAFDPAFERVHPLQYLGEAPPFVWLLGRALRNANRELIPLKGELERLRADLTRLRAPILVLHGTRDRLVPYGNVAYLMRMAKRVPRLEARPLAGEDHFIVWTQEEAVEKAIIDMDRWLVRLASRTIRSAGDWRGGRPAGAGGAPKERLSDPHSPGG